MGPGAYGVALAADGAVWTSLPERGELVRVGQSGQVRRVPLDAAQSRPMVLTPGAEPHGIALASDGAVWVALEAGTLARLTADPPFP